MQAARKELVSIIFFSVYRRLRGEVLRCKTPRGRARQIHLEISN